MPQFNNLSQLAAYIQEKANSALKNEIAEATIKTMQEEIKDVVYSVYEPTHYVRQYEHGGLLDPANIEVTMVDDNTISVQNIRHDGDREVYQIVETGQGYQHNVPSVLTDGRPFTEKTREKLASTEILSDAMVKGLKRQGLDVKKV